MTIRFVIIGGGPAGNTAATNAARLGAEVTMIERDVVGGAAHLWDCIPSKSMIATGRAMSFTRAHRRHGPEPASTRTSTSRRSAVRIQSIKDTMRDNTTRLLESQGVRHDQRHRTVHRRRTRSVVDGTDGVETIEFDAALGRRPARGRVSPTGASPTVTASSRPATAIRRRSSPRASPSIGSGVTGVEFVHMFSSFGAKVTLVVSRQQVLPGKDPEVAAVLEDEFMRRGVKLLMGARAESMERDDDSVPCAATTAARSRRPTPCWPSARFPTPRTSGSRRPASRSNEWGYVDINQHCVTNVPHIYAAGDISGKLPLSSVASMQGRKVAEHVMGLHTRKHRHLDYDKAASAIFTEPEIADVGLAEAEAFSSGRKIRVTKVPFSSTPKAMINNDTTRLREDHLRPGHRRGARRVDRGSSRRRADLGHRRRRHRRPDGHRPRREHPRAPRSAKPSPKPPSRSAAEYAPERHESAMIAITARMSPPPTVSPAVTLISLTVPAFSALIWFSIFMASSTTMPSPTSTA